MQEESNKLSRRKFMKIVGISAASIGAASLISCEEKESNMGNASGPVPKGKITRKKVAGTEEDISVLGYGCMRWPTLPTPKKGENIIDQDAVNELIDYAIEHGVNYFDTAPVYSQGWNEEATGNALSRHPRESYYLATKMSNFKDWSYDNSVRIYENSREKLRTDYFDYYLIHNVGRSMEIFNERFIDNGVLDFLLEERKAGRIRKLGWSFHGKVECFDEILALHEKVHWDFVQIQVNYADWYSEENQGMTAQYLYNELEKRNIPVTVMEPLLGGRLAKLPDHLVARLKQRDPNSSVASWAFRFAGSKPNVYCVLSGMTYMEHLQDNIRTYSPLVPISPEEDEFLEITAELLMKYPLVPCNDCKYCMPCPYGLNIPAILVHYNKCVSEGNMPKSTMDSNYSDARRAYLVGYDRSVPKLRQADKCISCGECIPHCPQSINIPKELTRINKYVEQLKQEKFTEDT